MLNLKIPLLLIMLASINISEVTGYQFLFEDLSLAYTVTPLLNLKTHKQWWPKWGEVCVESNWTPVTISLQLWMRLDGAMKTKLCTLQVNILGLLSLLLFFLKKCCFVGSSWPWMTSVSIGSSDVVDLERSTAAGKQTRAKCNIWDCLVVLWWEL